MQEDYQAVFIFLLCLNLLFWIIIACWRFCTLINFTRTFSLTRMVGRLQNFRYYLQRRFNMRRRVNARITNLNHLNGISNRNLDLNSDLPPTYEEALKLPYPCVSTICSSVIMNNSNSTILNIGNLSDLDNLNILNQLDNQSNRQSGSILLCTGRNCNCINHLRESISNQSSIANTQLPESSSTATTSTLDTTFTTIIDQNPTSTNQSRNPIVETDLSTLSNKSNLFKAEPEPKDENQSNLELELRNSQINRSSTFNDLQSYLKNYLQNR